MQFDTWGCAVALRWRACCLGNTTVQLCNAFSAVLLLCLRSLAQCLWSPSFLPPLSPPSPHPHPILWVPPTPPTQTNPSLWVLQIPHGQGAVGVGTGSFPVMNSTGTAVQFHHSKNCSHGALNTVKTNNSKYLELIHELFGTSQHL